TDYRNDVAISPEIVKITADTYRTIRNTIRFQIGNLFDFEIDRDGLNPADLTPLDKWALHELGQLVDEVTEAYERFEFHRVYHLLNRFYTVTLSARYHDFLKDRLYTFRADSRERRSAQTVIHHHLQTLNRLWAPILVFTCEESFREAPSPAAAAGHSIHLQDWPEVPETWRMEETATGVGALLALRDPVNEQLESLRTEGKIGKSVEAALTIGLPHDSPLKEILENHAGQLAELFIVSSVKLASEENADPATITVSVAEGERCPRCWRTVPSFEKTAYGEVCPRCADALIPFLSQA
ncbi:MAG TPA: class I tRNA ligase family protein, partial [Oceanipulchritudo sp.]|nr:class I tRNA ligase family protein [Oceanipulchritudo sp.]